MVAMLTWLVACTHMDVSMEKEQSKKDEAVR